jgi:uncharacterized protein YdeI (YjbR/CyaY-like superfamily)
VNKLEKYAYFQILGNRFNEFWKNMKKNPEVDRFLAEKDHPMTDEINKVREIILDTDDRIEEAIKWSSPTLMYKGNIASFFMNAKKFVSLMFHKGATISDNSGLLEGDGKESRVARFEDLPDIEKKKTALHGVIREWIRMQDS